MLRFAYHRNVNFRQAIFLSILGITLTPSIDAQLPANQLHIVELARDADHNYHVYDPQYLSGFNPGGYTNQPAFLDEHTLLVSVNFPGEAQNDIYRLNLRNQSYRQVTNTEQSEFSPTPSPDGTTFACVRQVLGDVMDQQLMLYPLNQEGRVGPALWNVLNVGYFAWLSAGNVALFLVDDPVKLAIAQRGSDNYRVFASNIGRCLKTTADNRLAYVDKYSEEFWYLKELNADATRSEIVIKTRPGIEDFTLAGDGTYFMGDGSVLYQYHPDHQDGWRKVFDLAVFGVGEISRLAYYEGKLALVSMEE